MSLGHLDTLVFSHEMYDQVDRAMAFQAPPYPPASGGIKGGRRGGSVT